jgi:glycine hydroxymethyltransferase
MTQSEHASDIDNSVFPGAQGGPLMHNIAGKAVGFKEALSDDFEQYAAQTVANAEALADTLSDAGLAVVSGGTDNHLVLVDLRPSHPDTTGKDVEAALESTGIIMNANTVPGETRSPFEPSGIRLGTAALTTRGFNEAATREVGELIIDIVRNYDDQAVITDVSERVDELTNEYTLYQ